MTVEATAHEQNLNPGCRDTSTNIDIFRGCLTLWVMLAHLGSPLINGPTVPGRLAVWAFFIASGYLNANSFQRRLQRQSWRAAVFSYYLSRAKRIYPLLILSFLIVSITVGSLANNDVYAVFPVVYFTPEMHNGPLWTLIIELQLYAVTPLLFSITRRIRLSVSFLVTGTFGLTLFVSLAHSLMLGKVVLDDRSMLGNIGFYLLGMAIAIGSRPAFDISAVSRRLLVILAIVVFAWVEFIHLMYHTGRPVLLEGRFVPVILTFMVLTSSQIIVPAINGFLTYLGKMTYEVYVFHGLLAFECGWLFSHKAPLLAVVLFYVVLPIAAAVVYRQLTAVERMRYAEVTR